MSEQEQFTRFCDRLDVLVNEFSDEYDLSYAAIVGAPQMKAHNLCAQAAREYQDGDS